MKRMQNDYKEKVILIMLTSQQTYYYKKKNKEYKEGSCKPNPRERKKRTIEWNLGTISIE